MPKQETIVIGAGLGGLAAAIRLQAAGHAVRVFEQEPQAGGKANRISWQGYHFDTGPSLLTMPFVVDDLFRVAGKRREDYLEWERLEPACRYFFPDGSRFDMQGNLEANRDAIKAAFPDEVAGWDRFIAYGKQLWDVSGPAFLFNPMDWKVPLRLNPLKALGALPALMPEPMDRALHRYFKDPRLIQLFRRYATYNGSDPFRCPATFNVIPYVELAFGSWHCRGGMYALVQALEQLAVDSGVEFTYNKKVAQLHFGKQGRRIDQVEFEDGEKLPASMLVLNADAITARAGDLFAGHPRHLYWKNKYNKAEASVSGFVVLLAVKDGPVDLSCHNIFFRENYPREFREIFQEAGPLSTPTLYLHSPSRIDGSLAPVGGESWFLLANAPSLDRFSEWPSHYAAELERQLIEQFQKHDLGGETLKVEWRYGHGPSFFRDRYGAWQGSLYGLSSNSLKSAFFRVGNASPTEGLAFAGGSAHPGGGIPLVLLSGKMAAESLLQKGQAA